MIGRLFMPLDRQFDDGHESVADAFRNAAQKLSEEYGKLRAINGHLPINFLYRHAIELYLKSAILTVHRALQLPSGDGPHDKDPKVPLDGKWKPLHHIHSVKVLHEELKRLLLAHRDLVQRKTKGKWEAPKELDAWIETIEQADGSSTYFRYPITKSAAGDAKKSGFRSVDPDELIATMNAPFAKPSIVLALEDDHMMVETFALQDDPLPELREALEKACEMLNGAAFGLYAELVCGYGNR